MMSQENWTEEIAALCRHYVSQSEAERAAFRAKVNVALATALVAYAHSDPTAPRTVPEIENALLAAALADNHYEDWRDMPLAIGELRKEVEAAGEIPAVFVERVAPLVSDHAAAMLRGVFRRRLSKLHFADDAEFPIPQHNIFETLLHRPRLVFLLVWALEAALEVRIDRGRLKAFLKAVWSERLPAETLILTTEESRVVLFVPFGRGLVPSGLGLVVRLMFRPPVGILQKWLHRKFCEQQRLRFRTVIEGFTTAFAPLVFANADRLTMFKRSTHQIFEWQHHTPVLRQGQNTRTFQGAVEP